MVLNTEMKMVIVISVKYVLWILLMRRWKGLTNTIQEKHCVNQRIDQFNIKKIGGTETARHSKWFGTYLVSVLRCIAIDSESFLVHTGFLPWDLCNHSFGKKYVLHVHGSL